MNITAEAAREIAQQSTAQVIAERIQAVTRLVNLPYRIGDVINHHARLGETECSVLVVCTPEYVSNWLGLYNGEPVIFQSFVAFPYRDEALVSLQMNPHELRNAIMKFITQGLTDAGFNWRIAYYDNAIGDFGSFPAFHLRIRWGTNLVLA